MTPPSLRVWILPLAATLSALVMGGLACVFTVNSAGCSPLAALAGLALVAGLVGRWPGLAGVLVGGLLVLLGPVLLDSANAKVPGMGTSLAAVAALGGQAAWGAWLVRRKVGLPLTPGQARRWLLGLAWGGLIPSVPAGALLALAEVLLDSTGPWQALETGLSWCLGSTLAVAIGAPVALCFVGSPSAAWRPRRVTLALPLVTLSLMCALGAQWQARLRQQHFKQLAAHSAQRLHDTLRGPLMALQATAALHQADARISRDPWQAQAAWWLRQPYALQRMGFAQAISRADLHDDKRPDGSDTRGDDSAVLVRYVLGTLDEPSTVGQNLLAEPAARLAILASRRSGQVSTSFDASPDMDTATRLPLTLYQALLDNNGRVFKGVVWVSTSPQLLLDAAMGGNPSGFVACLIDITEPESPQGLAGPPGCEARPDGTFQHVQALPYGDRLWQFRLLDPSPAESGPNLTGWLGMLAVAAVGAMLGAQREAGTGFALHAAPRTAPSPAPRQGAPGVEPGQARPPEPTLQAVNGATAAGGRPAPDMPCNCRLRHTFMSRMSHELRTPLNAILGFSQLLCLDGPPALPARQRAWAQQVQHAGWHLLRMINDTLDLSRIDLDGVGLHAQAVALAPLIESSLAMVRNEADTRGIRLRTTVDGQAGDLLAEAPRVAQILHHLLCNAIRYNHDAGQVQVLAQPGPPGFIDIVVTDTGPGLSPDQLAQLFEPYNRLGREAGPVPGSGLGLAISHRLAERMGGTLHARSTVGQGSSFTLRLPQARPDHLAPPSHRRVQAVTGGRPPGGVVHYIEDDETNVEVMRGILLQRPDIELLVSVTGRQGLTMLRQRRPDLILLDMHLPDMNGHVFLQRLQQDRWLHNVPVILVSADATEASANLAMMAGARQYLTKPINVPELLAALDSVLGAEQPA